MSYIGVGIVYIGVHGGRFLELSEAFFGRTTGLLGSQADDPEESQQQQQAEEIIPLYCDSVKGNDVVSFSKTDSWFIRQFKNVLWYLMGMPLWYRMALAGKRNLTTHVAEIALKSPHPIRIGNVRFARAKLRCGDVRVVMLSTDDETYKSVDVETKLLRADSLHQSYDTQRMPNGKIVALPPTATSNQKPFLVSVKDPEKDRFQSINQRIGALAKRLKEEENLAIEDDPQQDPPEVIDFLIAFFYIVFGVIAMAAGMFSIFV